MPVSPAWVVTIDRLVLFISVKSLISVLSVVVPLLLVEVWIMMSRCLNVVLGVFRVILTLVVASVPLRPAGLVLVVVTEFVGLIFLACCMSRIRVTVVRVRLGLIVCNRLHNVTVLL